MERAMNIYLRSQSLVLGAAIVITATAAVPPVTAQEVYARSPENLKAREWFQDAKFGMFIHWGVYLNYMDVQLRELLTNYGEIGGVWFDGMWDKPDADWHLARTYGMIHQLQPQALVGSNHHKNPFPGEDFQMFEKDLPGQHTTGFNPEQSVSALPLETAETMNNSWGFNLTDEHYKSTADLIRYLVRAAGSNANFLLNVV